MTPTDPLNSLLVSAAQRWAGTPFREHARVCGPDGGVDCLQLAAALLGESGVIGKVQFPPYVVDFGEHATESPIEAWFVSHPEWSVVSAPEDTQPGDVLLFRVGRVVNHFGVMIGDSRFLHVLRGSTVHFSNLRDPTYLRRFVRAHRHVQRQL